MIDAKPATDWREVIAPDEEARLEALAADLRALQRRRATRQGKGRALHYKSHGGLRAGFTTLESVPKWARVGIFGSPATFRAYVRFSNGSGLAQPDATGDVRGVAVKLVGVPGRKLIEGMTDALTQDFLGILAEATPFSDPREFVGLAVALGGSPLLALPRLIKLLGFARARTLIGALRAGLSAPVGSMATRCFYSALPIRWGDYAVKYRFAPLPAGTADTTVEGVDLKAPDRFARDLNTRLTRGHLEFDFDIQPFIDEARTPIEDATRAWDATVSPWYTVGRLRLLQQDPASEAGRRLAERLEALSFDPWHAPEAFRPLGAMMRARKHAYRESVIEREAAPEPDGSEDW